MPDRCGRIIPFRRPIVALAALLAGCQPIAADDDDDATPTPVPYDPSGLPAGDEPVRAPLRVTVDAVIDGDTIQVDHPEGGTERVRFLSVNTPELHVDSGPPQCWAEQAYERTQELLPPDSVVWLTFDGELRDVYGRLLAYLYAGDAPEVEDFGDSVNWLLVREGQARTMFFENNQTFRDVLEAAEQRARYEDAGLWGCP